MLPHPNHSYRIPLPTEEVVYEIKKSRFIARVGNISNKAAAKIFLDQSKLDYPDARHHCWAYQFGPPQSPISAAMSDDGEPSGTAGKPILNVLQHKDIGDIMIVIIRYFGGIKLGAGGLVRAYSSATQLAIDHLPTELRIAKTRVNIHCDFGQEQPIRHRLAQCDASDISAEYLEQVTLVADLPQTSIPQFILQCEPLGVIITLPET